MTEPNTETAVVAAAPVAPAVIPLPTAKDASQARVDHVASLLESAYQKASTLTLTDEEVAKLTANFDDAEVIAGAGGDPNLLYIQHSSIRRRFAQVFRPGQWALINRRTWLDEHGGGFMYADCVLVIKGCYVGEAIGAQRWNPSNPRMNYSDAVEGAQSEALRRIAGKYLDCGIQVWDKTYCAGWKERNGGNAPKSAPRAQAPKPEPTPAAKPKVFTTAQYRTAWSQALTDYMDKNKVTLAQALDYAKKKGVILDTESLEDWSEAHIPKNKLQADLVLQELGQFINGQPIN